jgi:hypothetical protein
MVILNYHWIEKMKKYRKTKAKNQTYHFKKRCDERLGVQVDRKSIQRRIKTQKYDKNFYLLDRQSNRVTRYRYKFQNKWYIIPYDKNTHKVITIFEDNKQDIVLETETGIIAQQNMENNSISWLQKIIQFIKNFKFLKYQ